MADAAIEIAEKPVPRRAPLRFGAFQQDVGTVRALDRVRDWTRESSGACG